MRILLQKIKTQLRSIKGETIIESACSLLVLTILLLAITTMVQTALRITGTATRNATQMQQETINPIIWDDYAESEEVNIILTATPAGIEVTHTVLLNKSGDIMAFSPKREVE